jgi:transcriptional regulator with XRE-family HTH domain
VSRNKTRNRTSAEAFAERLKQVQKERGLTNEDAARELGVGLRLYQMWRADQMPGMKNLVRLARFYGVSVGWLLGEGTEVAA